METEINKSNQYKSNDENDIELQKNAITIMIEGINIAQKKGVYTLEESSKLFTAISLFLKKNIED